MNCCICNEAFEPEDISFKPEDILKEEPMCQNCLNGILEGKFKSPAQIREETDKKMKGGEEM